MANTPSFILLGELAIGFGNGFVVLALLMKVSSGDS
jgi:hypothetical protein